MSVIRVDARHRFELRFPCHTCKCLTIPVRAVESERSVQIDRFAHVLADVSCPVCGQYDQLVNSWVSARARHHVESRDRYVQFGYAIREDPALRAPYEDELPWSSGAPPVLRAPYDAPVVFSDWRDALRVVAL